MARIMAAFTFVFLLGACSEEHPDNLPGAVNNPHPDVAIEESSTVTFDPADGEMTHAITVTFSRSAPESGHLRYRTVSGTALADRDYMQAEQSINFEAGQRQVNVPVELINDPERLNDRTFMVELTRAENAFLTEQVAHQVTITANPAPDEEPEAEPEAEPDPDPTLNLPATIDWTAPTNGVENFSVVIPLSASLTADASVEIRTVNGTAHLDQHFQAVAGDNCDQGVCQIAAGRNELDFYIPITGQLGGSEREFTLQFLAAEGLLLPAEREVSVSLSYLDEVEVPVLTTPASLTLRMPTQDRAPLAYPIVFTLSEPLQEAATLNLRTVDDTAFAGTHYTELQAIDDDALQVSAGEREVSFALTLLHDADLDQNVSFELQLVSAENMALTDERSVTVEIINSNPDTQRDVLPTASLPAEVLYHEPASAREYQVIVPLSEAMPTEGSVEVSLIELSARDGVDFEAYSEVIDIPVNSTEILVPVTLLYNPASTDEQAFRVELSRPRGITLGNERSFSVQIVDALSAAPDPQLSLSPTLTRVPTPASMTEQTITLYFELSDEVAADSSVFVRSRNSSAASGIDFNEIGQTIALAEGATLLALEVTLLPTTADEPREFELIFSNPQGLRLPDSRSVTVQIDPRNTPAIPQVDVPEEPVALFAPSSSTGERVVVVPFDSFAPLRGGVQVRSQDQGAEAGIHYTLINGDIPFAIGAREFVILLTVEPAANTRSFELILEQASNLQLPDEFEQRIISVIINGNE